MHLVRVTHSPKYPTLQIKKKQLKIRHVLEAKAIPFIAVDIATDEEEKWRMREIADDPCALPPCITKGDVYLGVSE